MIGLGATSIHIFDDAFNIRKGRIMKLGDAMIDANISIDWSARGTVEVREDLIEKLAAAGCKRLHVGIEALDDELLHYYQKSCKVKHIEKFCQLCDKYGITILAYFIIGAPVIETEKYRQELPMRIEELGIRLPYFNVLSPLNETPFYHQMLSEGRLEKDYWEEFCQNPTKDFLMPSVRSFQEDVELKQTVDEYVKYFKEKGMVNFV